MNSSLYLFRLLLLGCLLNLLPGCVESYTPDVVSSTQQFLVVDGFINSRGISTIRLSRTFAINSTTPPPVESGAVLYIEQEAGPRYALTESTKGTYSSGNLTLTPGTKYRLHLTTQSGEEYTSDYTPAKTTPAIDAVLWRPESTGLTVYVNTHDDTNTSRYYRWEYDETWELVPPYAPEFEYVNKRIQPIATPYPRVCWLHAQSSAIRLAKTTSLSADVVSEAPLLSLSTSSSRLYSKYSVSVKQYALTREEYDYWELLRKNTENIGTLFDPLPSQLTGNVHCLNDPAKLALGFVGVHSQTEKRLFIRRDELPGTWPIISTYESCLPPDTVRLFELEKRFGPKLLYPIYGLYSDAGSLYAYTASKIECIDCRKRGSAVRPSFWQ